MHATLMHFYRSQKLIGHYLEDRVRSHTFLFLLAYYVEWHMRQLLSLRLFEDEDKQACEPLRLSPVKEAQPSPKAKHQAATKKCQEDGRVVDSFQTLLDDLATVTRNTVEFAGQPFDKITTPTPTQQKALNLLKVQL